PGHATISTGVFPATHGVISNIWFDRATAKTVTCTQDAAVRNIGAGRTASPGSRLVTMSLKARAAIMLAGHHADAVLWQDEFAGDWLTSSTYASELPAFARDLAARNPLSADSKKIWALTLPEDKYKGGKSVGGESP